MKLVFDIIKSGENLPLKRNYHFNKEDGTIGRSNEASWQLADKHNYISNAHVLIEYKDEVYFITDQSTNGTFLKFPYKRLPKGNRIKVNSTDIYILGDHEIQARFVEDDFSEDILDQFTTNEETSSTSSSASSENENLIPDDDFLSNEPFDNIEQEELNVMKIVNNESTPTYDNTVSSLEIQTDDDQSDLDEQHISIPKFAKKDFDLDSNIKDTSLQRSISILESKLGIEICSLEKDDRDIIMEELGDIILNTLSSLKHSLHLKEKVKEDLRVLKANEKTSDVNPILFGQSASSLLKNQETGGLLGMSKISEAITQSFEELDNHNIALHASSKNIIQIASAKFSPKNLEYHFESSGALRSFFIPKKVMIWRAYKNMFNNLDENPQLGVDLINDDFSKEYNNIAYSISLATQKLVR